MEVGASGQDEPSDQIFGSLGASQEVLEYRLQEQDLAEGASVLVLSLVEILPAEPQPFLIEVAVRREEDQEPIPIGRVSPFPPGEPGSFKIRVPSLGEEPGPVSLVFKLKPVHKGTVLPETVVLARPRMEREP